MTIPLEPPNGSTVGWGTPTSEVHIRLDEEADGIGLPDERWYEANDPALDAPLCWEAVIAANASSGEPYLLERKPLVADNHVPRTGAHLIALTDDPDTGSPDEAVQFAVLDPDGSRHVYGDQTWVASGVVLDAMHPAGRVQRRDVTISYGEWADHNVGAAATSDG
jgi:hypothetical protein